MILDQINVVASKIRKWNHKVDIHKQKLQKIDLKIKKLCEI
jgi:hypothetical protein